ncbi:MAG: ABC transporter permease [bacterium]
MKNHILKSLLTAIITLLIVITLNFFLPRMIFSDPAAPYLIGIPEDEVLLIEQIREAYGFNDSIFVQFGIYLKNVFTLNFGNSYIYKEPVFNVMFSRMPWSIFLNLTVLLISVFSGIIFGSKAAKNRGRKTDRFLLKSNSILASIPTFWLALISVIIFSFVITIFPYSGAMSPGYSLNFYSTVFVISYVVICAVLISIAILLKKKWMIFIVPFLAIYVSLSLSIPMDDIMDVLYHSVLPIGVVAIGGIFGYAFNIRNYMLNVVNEDYILTAQAKGLPNNVILYRHTFKNAMLPLVTGLGVSFVGLFGGSVLIEQIFSWPGMGQLMLEANNMGDFQLAQAILLFFSILTILANLITDLIYHKLDPRVSVN